MLGTDNFAVLSSEELEQVAGGGYIYFSGLEHQNIPAYWMHDYSSRVQNAIRDAMFYAIRP